MTTMRIEIEMDDDKFGNGTKKSNFNHIRMAVANAVDQLVEATQIEFHSVSYESDNLD